MINSFIAYDDNDSALGEYFESSHGDIFTTIQSINTIINTSICGLDCTEAHINACLSRLNGARFIFIALSHGDEHSLVSHEIYVSANNSNLFQNSLFYSCACSTGHTLGNNLIQSGCLAFIGYTDTVYVIVDYELIFFTCQNFAIKCFLMNNETLETSFDKMIKYYNTEIDRLLNGSMDDLIAASSLIKNRESLTLMGNKFITRDDFN